MEETFLATQEGNECCEHGETTILRLRTEILQGVCCVWIRKRSETTSRRVTFLETLLQARQAYRQSNNREVRNELNDVQKARGCFPKEKGKGKGQEGMNSGFEFRPKMKRSNVAVLQRSCCLPSRMGDLHRLVVRACLNGTLRGFSHLVENILEALHGRS